MFENEFIEIKPLGPGMLYCKYKKGVVINLEGAKKIVRERLEFQKGVDYFILVDASEVMFITSKAKAYFRTHGEQGVKCYSIIMNANKVHRLILNAYAKLAKKVVPFKVFTDYEDAKSWLEEQVIAVQDVDYTAAALRE